MRIVIIGCGGVGGAVARLLAAADGAEELVVADCDEEVVSTLGAELGTEFAACDARDPSALHQLFTGADIVFNAVGPFHRFALPIVQAALEAQANYVDINDDFDIAEALVTDSRWDAAARRAGVAVITGAGMAPGLTNVLAKWAVGELDVAQGVDVAMAVPFVVNMGRTINDHMFHCMSGEVTQFLDGRYQKVKAGGQPQRFELLPPFGSYEFGYMGHSESITVPHFIPGLRDVTTRFTWLQRGGNELYRTLDQFGLMSDDQGELPMSPRAFLAEYTASPAGEEALGLDVGDAPLGAVFHVRAHGRKNGHDATVILEAHYMYSAEPDEVDGDILTAVPAAAVINELVSGGIAATGVLAPEACIDPEPFVKHCCDRVGIELFRRTVIDEEVAAAR